MEGLNWRMIREDDFLENVAGNGINRTIRIEGVPLRISNRDACVLAFALHTRAALSTSELAPVELTAREAQRLMHGSILLPGRNSVGLVPTSTPADAIATLNAGHSLGNCGMAQSGIGGLIDEVEVAEGEVQTIVESTLILPYAPRALSCQRDGTAGVFDGAIDSIMFDLAPPTLSLTGLGQRTKKIDVDEIQTELWVCLATAEPGEAIAPTRPQIMLLGDVTSNPQHFGLGNISDVQVLSILDHDLASETALPIYGSAAAAAIELDAVEILESPWRSLVRQVVQEGLAGFLFQLVCNLSTALLLTPAVLPKASERHKGSKISIEGWAPSVFTEKVFCVAWTNQAPDPEVLAAWAEARGVDLASARVHGETVPGTGLDDRRFVGISPIYSKRGR